MGSCSLHPAAATLHPAAATLHPAAATLHPADATLHPAAATLHPAAATLHPATATLHPEFCYRSHSTRMTSEILLPPPFHLDVLHPEFRSRMGKEGVSTSSVINFVDYSLSQGAPAGHESADTSTGHESNGAVAGEGANFIADTISDGGRLVKRDIPHNKELELSLNIMEVTPEDQHSHHGHQDNPNEFISMRDRMHPPHMSAPSCIVPPYRAASDQTAYCATSTNFPWNGKTNGLKRQISNFSAKENEKFYECWERYMEAINACPHHGFDTWLLVSYFYDGMSSSMKQLLETMCGGDFMSKNLEEAMDFLSYVAEVSRGWDEPHIGEVGKMKSQPSAFNAKAGMYTLNEDDDMKVKFAAMTRRLEELELKKMHEVQAVAETPVQGQPCPICHSYEHLVEECPTIPAVKEMFGDQANVIGQFRPNNDASYGNTYNSSWRNHPSFSWKPRASQYQQPAQPSQPSQPSQQSSSLEQAIVNLSKVVEDFVGDQNPSTLILARLTNLNTMQEKGRFPSQPHQNPKGIQEVETHEGESSQVRDVKALITLRSSKKVEPPTLKPYVEEKKDEETKKREEMKGKKKDISEGEEDHGSTVNANLEKELIKEEMLKKRTSPPFP
ncbi:hypothetical protein CK203_045617 [Vitis vinifera]|uniref:Retrotransposon gag domain-containing protein n=1 Tax=Vitis vinifera TaxID=29760 RepID=A0A438HQ83_VITVI|nr:hypothetical protein CK203_045617 [Vitis vinifera]